MVDHWIVLVDRQFVVVGLQVVLVLRLLDWYLDLLFLEPPVAVLVDAELVAVERSSDRMDRLLDDSMELP